MFFLFGYLYTPLQQGSTRHRELVCLDSYVRLCEAYARHQKHQHTPEALDDRVCVPVAAPASNRAYMCLGAGRLFVSGRQYMRVALSFLYYSLCMCVFVYM